eukprot:TRINITY_DN7905_c0_g1_i1.p1 TRINITY_DN7905_c0_g1~~TRINITY_DN7905_c0_g1_i1.p1  ORF type:complete len:433 (-),score=78.33 TRINITY_DN7905_c0_g1_i1:35-1333(-)
MASELDELVNGFNRLGLKDREVYICPRLAEQKKSLLYAIYLADMQDHTRREIFGAEESWPKKRFLKTLSARVKTTSIKFLVSKMHLELMIKFLEPAHINHGANNPYHAVVLRKRITETLEENSLLKYLDNFDKHTLREIYTAITDGATTDMKGRDLKQKICQIYQEFGYLTFLESFSTPRLRQFITVSHGVKSAKSLKCSRTKLLYCVYHTLYPSRSDSNQFDMIPSKQLPAIEKGISVTDLRYYFTTGFLRDELKARSCSSSGNKLEMAKRLHAYLNDDMENAEMKKNVLRDRRKAERKGNDFELDFDKSARKMAWKAERKTKRNKQRERRAVELHKAKKEWDRKEAEQSENVVHYDVDLHAELWRKVLAESDEDIATQVELDVEFLNTADLDDLVKVARDNAIKLPPKSRRTKKTVRAAIFEHAKMGPSS